MSRNALPAPCVGIEVLCVIVPREGHRGFQTKALTRIEEPVETPRDLGRRVLVVGEKDPDMSDSVVVHLRQIVPSLSDPEARGIIDEPLGICSHVPK